MPLNSVTERQIDLDRDLMPLLALLNQTYGIEEISIPSLHAAFSAVAAEYPDLLNVDSVRARSRVYSIDLDRALLRSLGTCIRVRDEGDGTVLIDSHAASECLGKLRKVNVQCQVIYLIMDRIAEYLRRG